MKSPAIQMDWTVREFDVRVEALAGDALHRQTTRSEATSRTRNACTGWCPKLAHLTDCISINLYCTVVYTHTCVCTLQYTTYKYVHIVPLVSYSLQKWLQLTHWPIQVHSVESNDCVKWFGCARRERIGVAAGRLRRNTSGKRDWTEWDGTIEKEKQVVLVNRYS